MKSLANPPVSVLSNMIDVSVSKFMTNTSEPLVVHSPCRKTLERNFPQISCP